MYVKLYVRNVVIVVLEGEGGLHRIIATSLYALVYCLSSSCCWISSAVVGGMEVDECGGVERASLSNLVASLTASMMAGISSLVRNDPPALLSCLGRFMFRPVGCDPRKESLLLLPAAAADVSVRVARNPPCRWLAAPRRELRVVVAGFAGIATAGWGRRPLPLPRRVLISGSSIRL